ncbi:hypothetical protein F4801DRAFT_467208 [Xylaria longipes]|nr:hypothetical protein F4801DRAFT_467208 [Xylaria longipes]
MGDEYKPYTTPYTGTGAVKTEQGWVSSRDLGAPGAASGPGTRRDSGPPVPPFHQTELTTTNVAPPPGHENPDSTADNRRKRSFSLGSRRTSRSGPINHGSIEIQGIKGPDGIGFDLPKHYQDLSEISNKDIALKIGLLHLKKGNIHEDMHQAATNRDILSREPHEQFKFRNENAQQLNDVEEAIRAWEEVQAARAQNIPNPGLVDMLMISQDYYEKEEPIDQQSAPSKGASSPDFKIGARMEKSTES